MIVTRLLASRAHFQVMRHCAHGAKAYSGTSKSNGKWLARVGHWLGILDGASCGCAVGDVHLCEGDEKLKKLKKIKSLSRRIKNGGK